MAQNNDLSVHLKSDVLKKRRITLCVTGSIAAVETVKLARELRRHGAGVWATLTPSAEKFITPLSLQWATAHPVVTELSGHAEHIVESDLVLVAPASLHTLNKIALGLADNVVTTTVASAWGKRIPIVIIPAMHESLYDHPVLKKNLSFLSSQKNIHVFEPRMEEHKAKFLDAQTIVARTSHILNQKNKLTGKRILITAGPTQGPIDRVRYITNYSTGELGVSLARELYMRGACPTLIYGPGFTLPDEYYPVKRVRTPSEMLDAVLQEGKTQNYDAAVFAAAVLDHVPQAPADKKLSSKESLQIEYSDTPKIVREMDRVCRLYKIAFKLEWKKTDEELKNAGVQALETMNAQAMVVNDLSQITQDRHPAILMDRKDRIEQLQNKQEIVQALIEKLQDEL